MSETAEYRVGSLHRCAPPRWSRSTLPGRLTRCGTATAPRLPGLEVRPRHLAVFLGEGPALRVGNPTSDRDGTEHVAAEVRREVGRSEVTAQVLGHLDVRRPRPRINRWERQRIERRPDVVVVGPVGEVAALVAVHLATVGVDDHHAGQCDAVTFLGIEQVERPQEPFATGVGHERRVGEAPPLGHAGLADVVVDTDRGEFSAADVDAVVLGCQLHELAAAVRSPVPAVGHHDDCTVRAAQGEEIGSVHRPNLVPRQPTLRHGGRRTFTPGRGLAGASAAAAVGSGRRTWRPSDR